MGGHFFTGFPGFVATEIIEHLFEQGVTKEVYAVVLQSELARAKSEVQRIEQQFEDCQIVLFEGDITLPDLDIEYQEMATIAPKIDVVWHLAAIHDLNVKRDQAWKVNVHGTANVNEFVCRLPNLKRYMYFSTSFIAGKRQGKILEMELIRPPAFHNYMEETKFEAELLVDDLKLEVPITILRPSMIYGYSKTGVTKYFDGLYLLMNLVSYLKEKKFIPKIGSKQALFHVVAIDYVVKASVALSEIPEAEGETVHLTDANPYNVMLVYSEIVKIMTNRKMYGTLPLGIAKAMLEQPSIGNTVQVPPQFVDYLDYMAELDTKDCKALLASSNVPHTDLIQTLPTLISLYEKNKQLKK